MQGKILFIDASELIAGERKQTFLQPEHQERILLAYQGMKSVPGFAGIADLTSIRDNKYSLGVAYYVGEVEGELQDSRLRGND